jgi:uncharacterized membrane protein (GlpM family)
MSQAEESLIRQRLRVMQIISGFIFLGLILFLTTVWIMVWAPANRPGAAPVKKDAGEQPPVLSLLALGFLAVMGLLAAILPALLTRKALRRLAATAPAAGTALLPGEAGAGDDLAGLLVLRQTVLLVRLALIEGIGFLGGLSYLIERHWLALAVALSVVLWILLSFPTESGLRSWLTQQQEQLLHLRQQAEGPPAS